MVQRLPPISRWLERALFVLGGYALRWWVSGAPADAAADENETPARRKPRRVPPPPEELKLVLVINDSLKMGKGKIGAQCGHAAVGAVEELHAKGDRTRLAQWERGGQPKICLKAQDTMELRQLAAAAAAQSIPTFVVRDAGRTQVAAGSLTVLAIGPAPVSQVNSVTGHLKLL